jgi:alanine racemase
MFYRPTWAEIDVDALIKNYQYVQSKVHPKQVIPVIKANAYGHGAVEVMKALFAIGVRFFAVSLLEEAIELRKENHDIDLLMLGPILPSQFSLCEMHNIQFTLYDQGLADEVLRYPRTLSFHLKFDSGMHRYGFTEEDDVIRFMREVKKTKHQLVGIYSHFATANEQNNLFYEQIDAMKSLISRLPYRPHMIHLSNSSASIRYESHIDFTTHVRLGISLYGLSLDEDKTGLHPVMKLKTQVVQIKRLKAGQTVGYGGTYQAKEDERIAILPIGYADGWIRRNKTGMVEIRGSRYKTVGIICMDACFIKVDESVQVGDEVTLFGGLISIDEVAKRLSTIHYEVTCLISSRVPRHYVKGGNL